MKKPLRIRILLIYAWLLPACVTTTPADYELNTDFEIVEGGHPWQWQYWYGDSNGYRFALDSDVKCQGQYALRIEASQDSPRAWAGVAGSRLPIWFKMRHLRLRGYLKRDAVAEDALAGLWCRVQRRDGYPRHEEHSERARTPSEDWTWYELSMPLDENATEMAFGGMLNGQGRLWLDSLSLDVDGIPYAQAADRAATTVASLWLPTLSAQARPLSPDQPWPALHARLASAPLTVLWLPDDGLQAPWQVAQQLWQSGHYRWLALPSSWGLLRLPPPPPEQVATATPNLLPDWQPSAELTHLLQTAAGRDALTGIDLGLPDPVLLRLRPVYGHHRAWRAFDSLHRHLMHQIGRSLVSRSSVQLLRRYQAQLGTWPRPDSLAADWQWLDQLPGFYARQGASAYRDSCRLATLERLLAQGPTLLLMRGSPQVHQRTSFLRRLRAHFGAHACVVGLTVGQGQALRPAGAVAPLHALGPHCYEAYLDQLGYRACWLDLAPWQRPSSTPWQPRQMFWRNQEATQTGQPFTTLRLSDAFDVVVYLADSGPAHPPMAQRR